MKPLDQEVSKEPSQQSPDEVSLAVALSKKLMKEAGGLNGLKKALSQTQDPAEVVAKFLVQLLMKVKEVLDKEQVELPPESILEDGGWMDQMLDFLEDQLGLPPEFSDEVGGAVLETFKALAQGERNQAAAPPQQQQQPQPMPGPVQQPPQGVM